MDEIKKNYKIELKGGDTVQSIFDFINDEPAEEVCFVLDRHFLLVTEIKFLKKLKTALNLAGKKAIFVTSKPYFKELLEAQKFEVVSVVPARFESMELRRLRDFGNRIEAEKNEPSLAFQNHKIDFAPRISGTSAKPQFSTRRIENLAREKSLRGIYFFIFFFLITLLGLVFILISPRASIVIKPRISSVETNQNIIVALPGATIPEADIYLPQVDGVLVQTNIEGEMTFPSTDRTYDLTDAGGSITLFNQTDEPKFLLPSRLQAPGNIILRMTEEVTIPPRADGNPGEAVVQVRVDSYDLEGKPIGNRGNLDAGTDLFFPALRRESRELYYGKVNRGPLTGGSTLTRYFIGEQDFETAQPVLQDAFLVQGTERLKEELVSRSNRENKKYVLLDQRDLLLNELVDYQFPEAMVGVEVPTFLVSGNLKISGIVFDQSEVIKYLEAKLEEKQDHRKKIIEIDENSLQYRVLDAQSREAGLFVKLSVSMIGVETLDLEADNEFAQEWRIKVKRDILGKNIAEARGILINHPEIESIVSFELSPFWITKVPHLIDQVKMKIQF